VKHRLTPLNAKLKESLAGWLAPQEAEAYQHKAENQKTTGIEVDMKTTAANPTASVYVPHP